MLFALLADWAGQFYQLRHFETHFVLDDFEKRDIRRAQVAGLGNQRPAQGAGTGVELPDPA